MSQEQEIWDSAFEQALSYLILCQGWYESLGCFFFNLERSVIQKGSVQLWIWKVSFFGFTSLGDSVLMNCSYIFLALEDILNEDLIFL